MKSSILIVENHEQVRSSVVDLLTSLMPQCDLLEASDGESGVAMAIAHEPDIVLMDVRLPRVNGLAAVRQIRAERPDAKIVMLTVHDNPAYRREAERAGAVGYILKEDAPAQLVPLLKALLSTDGPPGESASGVKAGD